jgi:bifunctional non-homologous end joining protein LigD
MNPLDEYKKKRRFGSTPEPPPEAKPSASGRSFVVQKHCASHLHYDVRLESAGVLKSWAVPKGPSLNPAVKRLAMAVEDHPVDYSDFEGIIPEGEYGGGIVMVWDRGTYEVEGPDDPAAAIEKGELKFTLHGTKLAGSWVLVRTRNRQWLLIKHRDRYASDDDITVSQPTSVLTGRKLADIAADEGGEVEKASRCDQPSVSAPPGKRPTPTSRRKKPS